MNMFLLFLNGMIFLTCFYGQSQQYAVSWILVFGMIVSAIVSTLIITEAL